jgi:dihydropteroate synthase
MKAALARLSCGVVLMHTRGRPDEWRSLPTVPDIAMLTKKELRQRSDAAVAAGIKRDRIVIDPGFGFGKRFEENYPLLRRLGEFQELRFPLLAGVSRKSFVGRVLAQNGQDASITDRQSGSLGAEVALALKGAHIIRTHNVRACVEALKLADLAAN